MFIQQEPVIVEVFKQPEISPDISIDVVIGMFSMVGVMLLIAALGGLVVGAIFVGIRRYRDASAPPPTPKTVTSVSEDRSPSSSRRRRVE